MVAFCDLEFRFGCRRVSWCRNRSGGRSVPVVRSQSIRLLDRLDSESCALVPVRSLTIFMEPKTETYFHRFMCIVMMYIAIYPVALSIRSTNVYVSLITPCVAVYLCSSINEPTSYV